MAAFSPATLVTRRLLLSPLRPADAGPMAIVLGDPRLHEFTGGSPASPAALADRYRRLAVGSPDPAETWLNWIVRLRATAEPVGTVQATVTRQPARPAAPAPAVHPAPAVPAPAAPAPAAPAPAVPAPAAPARAVPAPAAAVAWVIGVRWQGSGYATEAAGALVQWLERRGAAVITANIHPDHHASAAVAAAVGLVLTSAEADGERVWQYIPGPVASNPVDVTFNGT
jgi:RimJ/RimL family protein N-acetyltransferase